MKKFVRRGKKKTAYVKYYCSEFNHRLSPKSIILNGGKNLVKRSWKRTENLSLNWLVSVSAAAFICTGLVLPLNGLTNCD